ncbi:MAG: hypothetical protein B7Z37_10065 [Verrucomicrobia bacterium 12-59-8]|nr:MAG: hypothetical protein B7Z37_10065 [Verrucomicrobia bacterium 12-59-8]
MIPAAMRLILATLFLSVVHGLNAREWKSTDGTKTFQGQLISYRPPEVTVILKNGTHMSFNEKLLSKADKRYCVLANRVLSNSFPSIPFKVIQVLDDGMLVNELPTNNPYYSNEFMMIWGDFKHDVADNELYRGDIYWAGSYTYTDGKGYERTVRSFASSLDDAVAIWEYRLSPSEKGRTPKLTKEILSSSGSGFAVTSIGHVVTNAHVVDGAQKISVRLGDKLVAAKLVAIDQQNDLAVIKVDGATLPLKVGETDAVRLGDEITVGGFPNPDMQGTSLKLTRGVISGMKGAHDDVRHYQIDAAIQPGNSGGPLLSTGRSVVGVVNARLNDSAVVLATGSIPQNVNYAIKTDYLMPLIRGVDGLTEQIAKETYPQELSIGQCLERSAYQIICDLSPE